MDHEVQHKLETLRSDYREVIGRSFLALLLSDPFRDRNAELCRAHIINSAFPDSCRKWTVQRADVDSFYGSAFESDFVDLQYSGKHLTDDAIIDPLLSKKLRPKVYIGEKKGGAFYCKWTRTRAFHGGPCKWARRFRSDSA